MNDLPDNRLLKVDPALGYQESGDIFADASSIIIGSRSFARRAVNVALVQRNWLLGKRIAVEELKGQRAEYGKEVIRMLSRRLSRVFGKGFEPRNLYRFVRFYKTYPEILTTLLTKSDRTLSWSHYLVLLRVDNAAARDWYEREALDQNWSVRTLDRNVNTLYYDRLLMSQDKSPVITEMEDKTAELQQRKLEFIKDPVIAEFLELPQDKSFLESDLEQAIISNLEKFIMELGKGYAFVARQQHIKTDQMDMYVRMYDDLKRREDDNPTIGIVLCTETSETIARYSVLHDSEQLYAAKYKLYLPSEEELRTEIEHQKLIYRLQHETD